MIVVHGPTGGAGKTTIALHLAYLLAAKGCSTVLVDLTQYGAVAPWLRIPRGNSRGLTGLTPLVGEGGLMGARIREAFVPAPRMEEQLQLILSSGPAKMDQVRAAEIERLLGHMAAVAQVIIVDTGSELTERVLGALMASTRVLLTVMPHVVAGWQALELTEILRSAHIPKDRLGLVFNRVRSGGQFGLEEYQRVLGLPVLGTIPETPALQASAEQGGPPKIRDNGPGMSALRQLAHQLIPVFCAKELRGSWLLRR